jgi:hypothetical protein
MVSLSNCCRNIGRTAWEHSLPNLAEATPIHVLSKAEGPPFGRVWEPGLLESYWSGFGVRLHGELHGELVEPLSSHQPDGLGAFPPSVIVKSH